MPATINSLSTCAQPTDDLRGRRVPPGGSPLTRWLAFNAVGVAGMAVQLAVVAALVHLGCHYLVATVLAVEAAIVHNFLWHQRWTWRDRPAQSASETAGRLLRFQVLNGTISLLGNVGVTAWFTGIVGLNPIGSNLIAITVCSLLNFVFSEALVFSARQSKQTLWSAPQIAIVLLVAVAPVVDAGPGASTLAAWRDYEARVDSRYKASLSGGQFFALDGDSQSRGWRNDVLHGQPHTIKIDAPSVDNGKIHHWVGAIYVPGMTVPALIDRLEQNAGHESEHYEDVLASRLIARDGDRVQVYLKLRRTNLITVTYNTEHVVDYNRIDDRACQRPQRRHQDCRAREYRNSTGAREVRGRGQRLSLAVECVLALRSSTRRRAGRMRIGEPEPSSPHAVASRGQPHRRSDCAGIAHQNAADATQRRGWKIVASEMTIELGTVNYCVFISNSFGQSFPVTNNRSPAAS